MKLVEVKCPNCNSHVKILSNSKTVVCDYCKTEFLVDDGVVRTEIHKTITDEAKIKELEVKNEMHARNMENKERERKNETKTLLISIGCIVGLLLLSLIVSTVYSKIYVTMPESHRYYEGKNYKIVKSELEDLGFKNIEVRTIDDLVLGLFSKEEDVESVSIGGVKNFESNDDFKKSDKVVITYHIYKKK